MRERLESVSDCIAYVCIFVLYRRDVYVMYFIQYSQCVHLMYIFLSLFSVDGFYCAVLLDIVLICCCTPDNDVDSPSPDMGRHISTIKCRVMDKILFLMMNVHLLL